MRLPVRMPVCAAWCTAVLMTGLPALGTDHHVPGDFTTIQAAVDGAASGDTILIAPGIYPESLTIDGKILILAGEGGSPEETRVSGAGIPAPVITITAVPDGPVRVENLQMEGGTGWIQGPNRYGGGAYIDGSQVVFTGVRIESCAVQGVDGTNPGMARGGAVYALNSQFAMLDCVLEGNSASGGSLPEAQYGTGAEASGGGIHAFNCTVNLTRVEIQSNICSGGHSHRGDYYQPEIRGPDSFGGGGCFRASSVQIHDCTIYGNHLTGGCADDDYGGECPGATGGTAYGGGLYFSMCSRVLISGGVLTFNSADAGYGISWYCGCGEGGDAYGGGVYLTADTTDATVVDTVIDGNTCLGGEGSCYGTQYCYGGGGFGGGLASGSPVEMSRCVVSGNSVRSGIEGHSGKRRSHGGGIWADMLQDWTLENIVLWSNAAEHRGAAIYLKDLTSARLMNCTLWGHIGDGTLMTGSSSAFALTNCIYWNNQKSQAETFAAEFSDLDPPVSGTGNISADPLFAVQGDWHLSGASPCIDAGTTTGAPPNDIDGDYRPYGAGVDMGADEATNGPPPATPTPFDTPPPVPTATPNLEFRYQLLMGDLHLVPGDRFNLELCRLNPGEPFPADEYIALQVMDSFWFYPSWTPDFNGDYTRTIPHGHLHDILLEFDWPETTFTCSTMYFWALLLEPDSFNVMYYCGIDWSCGTQ